MVITQKEMVLYKGRAYEVIKKVGKSLYIKGKGNGTKRVPLRSVLPYSF